MVLSNKRQSSNKYIFKKTEVEEENEGEKRPNISNFGQIKESIQSKIF